MRRELLILSMIAGFGGLLLAQAPRPPAPAPTTPPAPAQPALPAPRPARATTSTITVQVTDPAGLPLSGVQVAAQGPVTRDATTAQDGAVRFANMRAGNYRLRFVREGSITLERDITMRTGEPLTVDVTLSAAPAPPKPVEPERPALVPVPSPVARPLGPPSDPKITPIPGFLEKNFIGGREGRRDSSLGCTSTATATLHQLREAWLNHAHDDADEWLYVVAGEGTLRMGNAEQRLQAGTFSLIPRTVTHAILPTGRNPLVVFSVLSGPPCKP
jgi:mannose-6-phosphate isomerase-like protein (cupin superfamily)